MFAVLLSLSTTFLKAQSYTPNVSKDSLAVLNDRVAMLRAHLKLNELKIKESETERNIEKLRVKLISANAKAKESAAKSNNIVKRIAGSADAKEVEKIAKAAKADMEQSQKALDAYNKQIRRVESIKSEISVEEQKILAKKPRITFGVN